MPIPQVTEGFARAQAVFRDYGFTHVSEHNAELINAYLTVFDGPVGKGYRGSIHWLHSKSKWNACVSGHYSQRFDTMDEALAFVRDHMTDRR